jgi:GMP synthase (glutamine-hydrolysing)
MENTSETVIILDFGGKHAQMVARRVREAQVFCEILSYKTPWEEILKRKPKAIILSGGSSGMFAENAPTCDERVFEGNVPVLGIGYGMYLMIKSLGGEVKPNTNREKGLTELIIDANRGIFQGLERKIEVFMDAGDYLVMLPKGFEVFAHTEKTSFAAVGNGKNLYGIQFHPEENSTANGREILNNFLFDIAGCSGTWSMNVFIQDQIKSIRELAGNRKVICGLSGGVDSSVAALLVHKAIGDNLTCIFVDHGLLRKNEADYVINTFKNKLHMNLIAVDVSQRFLNKLKGVIDPEKKRMIIGEEFIRVFEEEAAKLGKIDFLVQGTVYPDVIESGTPATGVIKSHHNVGGLPDDLEFKLIEPLRELFRAY